MSIIRGRVVCDNDGKTVPTDSTHCGGCGKAPREFADDLQRNEELAKKAEGIKKLGDIPLITARQMHQRAITRHRGEKVT